MKITINTKDYNSFVFATDWLINSHFALYLPQSFTEYTQSFTEFLGHLRCQETSEVAFAEGWSLLVIKSITLDLKQDFSGALTPATVGGKLPKTKKLCETLRVLYETLR